MPSSRARPPAQELTLQQEKMDADSSLEITREQNPAPVLGWDPLGTW